MGNKRQSYYILPLGDGLFKSCWDFTNNNGLRVAAAINLELLKSERNDSKIIVEKQDIGVQ